MSFNIWERWPWTSFQNLNLDWLMKAVKTAYTKAEEAFNKASAVENEVGTYTDQINAAVLTANQAMQIARNANEILFISADTENKAVNYVTWSQGGTGYVTAADIYNAIVVDHKMPVFMDRMQYIYEMAGYETDPDSPLTITRFKFTKNGGNREDVVWIDGTGSITYTHIDGSANGVPVVFNYIPPDPQLEENGRWVSDKTYTEILAAINSGRSIFLTVKINGETREIINNAYIYKSATATFLVLGYSKGFDTYDSPYYTNTGDYLVYYTINSNDWISVGRVRTVPSSSTAITGRVLTVNSSGNPEWMPASGGDTSGAVLYNTAQNLPAAYKEQAQNNIGIHDKVVVLAGSTIPSLSPGIFYDILGQRGSIEFTLSSPTYPGDANEYHVRFRTAAAPAETVIILPAATHVPVGFGVRQAGSTDLAYILSPDMVYEISILDNYLSFQVWEG